MQEVSLLRKIARTCGKWRALEKARDNVQHDEVTNKDSTRLS